VCVLLCLTKFPFFENILFVTSHFLDMVSAFDLFPVRSNFDKNITQLFSRVFLYWMFIILRFLHNFWSERWEYSETQFARNTSDEYQNMAPRKIGVSTLQKQRLGHSKLDFSFPSGPLNYITWKADSSSKSEAKHGGNWRYSCASFSVALRARSTKLLYFSLLSE
jgi:hypothetical protein